MNEESEIGPGDWTFWIVMLVTLVFVGLKFAGLIAWSWWLVFSPALAWILIVAVLIHLLIRVAFRRESE